MPEIVNRSDPLLSVSGIPEMTVAGYQSGLEIAQPAVAALENQGLLGIWGVRRDGFVYVGDKYLGECSTRKKAKKIRAR